jgi:hypothetical protein
MAELPLLFHANLHKFNTADEHIAAGPIWASLCAAVLKRFLARAGHIIDELVGVLLACPPPITEMFRDSIGFLLANARRANSKRDLKMGRLRSGLRVVGTRS